MVSISFWKVITGHWNIYRLHIPRIPQDTEMKFIIATLSLHSPIHKGLW